jgi:hypothetical protein
MFNGEASIRHKSGAYTSGLEITPTGFLDYFMDIPPIYRNSLWERHLAAISFSIGSQRSQWV